MIDSTAPNPPASMTPTAEQVIDRIARATSMLLDCIPHMSAETQKDFFNPLIQAFISRDTSAGELLARFWPNLRVVGIEELTVIASDILILGTQTTGAERPTYSGEFYGRLMSAIEDEARRRGFKDYADMASTASAVHEANERDRERDETVN